MAASVDALDGFLREMRTRFPDATARAPLPPETVKADPFPTGSLPAIGGLKRGEETRQRFIRRVDALDRRSPTRQPALTKTGRGDHEQAEKDRSRTYRDGQSRA